ncbi:MAG: ABC transporter ATP-binding protein [Verrucomicrobia bacterium]|nr:ABC transporter ATP-binding protein [Verrucomicrobiota bacterium]MCH8512150.1 ABC transporter ATP-binding protein [Kiritimatiellia bacterium]
MSTSLELNAVLKRYTPHADPAVDHVSLRVEAGELLALVGQSGSGKTTLLRLVSGLERPDAGEVLVGDEAVANAITWIPPEKRNIGMVFQDGALFPHLTVEKNIRYGLRHLGKSECAAKIESLLCLVGLDGFQKRYPHELSGGERQRLAVIRALAPEPKVVLLDEPFSNLDPALRRNLRGDIHRIIKELNTTAIMVTHDTDDALTVGDRVAVFKDGRIEQIGSATEVYQNPVNGYCARLFGPANLLGNRWIRPEQMELLPAYAPETHPVVVREIRDAGRHREIVVAPQEADPAETWIIHNAELHGLKVGGTGWVRLKHIS